MEWGNPLKRRWAEYTSEEFATLDKNRLIAVLPVGAIEQHGPHLPLGVDTCIVDGLIDHLIKHLPQDLPVVFLPTQPVGKSDEHLRFPGTLTLSDETLSRVWTEIGASVAHAGVRKIILLNSHGGQISTMEIVTRELRIAHNMLAFCVNWFGFGMPAGTYTDDELSIGIHAGDMETSVMLALRPDLVNMNKARDFRPLSEELSRNFQHLGISAGCKLGWQAQDLHPAGACGNASAATSEKGAATLNYAVSQLIEAFVEVDRAPLSWLNNTPEWG